MEAYYGDTMDASILEMLIPIVAIVTTMGLPVALVFVFKWFKLKERELQLDGELRKTAGQALESRVQRLESIILALDTDLRSRLSAPPHPELTEPEGGQVRELPARVK